METIKVFEFDLLTDSNKAVLYGALYPLYKNPTIDGKILKAIPEGNCVWVDSSCISLKNKNYIALENISFKSVFNKKDLHARVHFYDDMRSELICKAMSKVYSPTCFVFYFSPTLKYLTLDEFKNLILMYKKNSPNAKVLVVVDMKFVLYHRLNLTNDDAVSYLSPKKQTRLGCFIYQLEF